MAQLVPFHRSASVLMPLGGNELPAAVQAVADVHDTPLRLLPWAPLGLGVAWMAQLVPFHRSASVRPVPPLLLYPPTAVHAAADVHDTPLRALPWAPAGLGVDWMDQLEPFHRSARARAAPALLLFPPTAVHAVADEHDTAHSCPLATIGAGTD